eukprot:CAMPEP_0201149666 /NCGR_PEP_ID=MMETSP0851-20130426/10924_1 /ASSEMBLY_ACC=CAM_ASM_000631 /TAXON_ID=183588 /ORGANISM="Pseudo-nitzschia fraudulenta, Strain WWA7" /LENGTH=572 /DNA_ID=CAMNT_0047426107 /DNA_START=21 /DNA_END=1739 /DNA_ORIENTATION=+
MTAEESPPPPPPPSSLLTTESSERKARVKARWGILRSALLHSSNDYNESKQQHSIHRFSGYCLLKARPANLFSSSSPPESEPSIRRIEPFLTEYHWDAAQDDSSKRNFCQLEIAILALASCFPKGKCIRITRDIDTENENNNNSGTIPQFSESWLDSIKERCQPFVRLWKVSEGAEERKDKSTRMIVATLLIQETSTSTKYQPMLYDLDVTNKTESNGGTSIVDSHRPRCRDIIWTREPRETRLSLDDLVSHRRNNGVDNTGNICVWDSERTLAYLLYHHFDCFFSLTESCCDSKNTKQSVFCGRHVDHEFNHDLILQRQSNEKSDDSGIRILELGTGMAGLSAVALGIRLAMQRRKEKNEAKRKKNIRITLTDGNPVGVKNNSINMYLTKLNSLATLRHTELYPHYLDLDIECETLMWTTDIVGGGDSDVEQQDLVLVSDCVHFQNFHAALAITTLRCMRVGARAVFCQPRRGPSLDNFFDLLSTARTLDANNEIESGSLVSCAWLSHPIIEGKHEEAISHHSDVYDENLHRPKILVVTKLREMNEEDRLGFIAFQDHYNPIEFTSGDGKR